MSIESLTDGVYSTAGDVWSFGVVMWEVMSLAKMPYSIWTNHEVFENVVEEDYRLPRPRDCPPAVYALATLCWKEDPGQRATFPALAKKLASIVPTMSSDPLTKPDTVQSEATPEGGAGAPDVGEYDNAEAGSGGVAVSDYEVPVRRDDIDEGAESDDSFATQGLEFVDPDSLEPTALYYSQSSEEFVEVANAFTRSQTVWVKE
jgi:serine/threonine protein kinase